jgi:ribosomal protein S18 acetylase RimI-like enzyme
MLSILIKQSDFLTSKELEQLKLLAEVCNKQDNHSTKIYWDILKNKRDIPGNFLCYDECHQLIGYLSFFLFDDDAVTVSALVHPAYRRQKIFSSLLHRAYPEIKSLGIHKIIFSFPQKNDMAKKCLTALGASFLSMEYRMDRVLTQLEAVYDHKLKIRKANQTDIDLAARLDVSCFNSEYQVMLQRFQNTIMDLDREIWLAYLDKNCIGKAHIYVDHEGACIHDVGIIPSQQNKGFATELLKFVINDLISRQQYQMYLEVITTNETALHLYTRCHFNITDVYENWCIQSFDAEG